MTTASTTPTTGGRLPHPSNWLRFAGILGIVVGLLNIVGGFAAILKSHYLVVGSSGVLIFNLTSWGIIWLVAGVLMVIAGVGILQGAMWARTLGIVLAALVILGQFAYAGAFPIWSLIVVALAVVVIYGLVVPPRGSIA
ncbi:DUF7144 family membrane protein [Herbidospora sp. RD11066]